MTHGGARSGAGRKKGEPNKKTRVIEEILESLGCDPIKNLATIANGEKVKTGLIVEGASIEIDVFPTVDQRLNANKELAQYAYPKRKALEHSGSIGVHETGLEELE